MLTRTAMSGMKPSQRKVMYTAFRRKYKDTVKVVQFAGAVLETAAYHHGDTALPLVASLPHTHWHRSCRS